MHENKRNIIKNCAENNIEIAFPQQSIGPGETHHCVGRFGQQERNEKREQEKTMSSVVSLLWQSVW